MRAKNWVKELQRQASPSIVIALAGNKADLKDIRKVHIEVLYIQHSGFCTYNTYIHTYTYIHPEEVTSFKYMCTRNCMYSLDYINKAIRASTYIPAYIACVLAHMYHSSIPQFTWERKLSSRAYRMTKCSYPYPPSPLPHMTRLTGSLVVFIPRFCKEKPCVA